MESSVTFPKMYDPLMNVKNGILKRLWPIVFLLASCVSNAQVHKADQNEINAIASYFGLTGIHFSTPQCKDGATDVSREWDTLCWQFTGRPNIALLYKNQGMPNNELVKRLMLLIMNDRKAIGLSHAGNYSCEDRRVEKETRANAQTSLCALVLDDQEKIYFGFFWLTPAKAQKMGISLALTTFSKFEPTTRAVMERFENDVRGLN